MFVPTNGTSGTPSPTGRDVGDAVPYERDVEDAVPYGMGVPRLRARGTDSHASDIGHWLGMTALRAGGTSGRACHAGCDFWRRKGGENGDLYRDTQ